MRLYHISNKKYENIKSIQLQPNAIDKLERLRAEGLSEDFLLDYITEVNFFLSPPDSSHKERMQQGGFKNWDGEVLYVHVVETDLIEHLYNYAYITSTPQQRQYDEVHWEEFYVNNEHLEAPQFSKEKRKYLEKREQHLEEFYAIKPRMRFEDLENHKLLHEWLDFDKHFIYNLKHGLKNQYQTYIPHVQVSIKEPLRVIETFEI